MEKQQKQQNQQKQQKQARQSQPARSRPARPRPATAVPPRLPMLLVAAAFGLLAVVAVVATVTTGALTMVVNAVMAAAISAMFAMVALRQRIELNRQGLMIHGFGSAGRRIRWKEVERLELTDAGRFRLGPRLIVRGGRSLPVPSQWRLEDGSRLPEAVLAWSRWEKIQVVGEQVKGRRWPIVALVMGGALAGMAATAAGW